MQMHKYPGYSQGYAEEEDYSSKDEFHYETSTNMSMMKADRCPTPPIHAYQPNFGNVTHGAGYATQNHSLDKFSHGGGYASHGQGFDTSMNSFSGHTQNSNKFGHAGGYGGYEQGFDKASHGYAGSYGHGGVSAGYNSQHQASHYGNDHYAHGGNYQGHGNNHASGMSHGFGTSGGHGAHQGGKMPMGGHYPPAPSWNFKGIRD